MNPAKNIVFNLTLAFLLITVCVTSNAHAIPAFSRAHKVECTTCHTIYPELNEYGEAFLKNSYVYTRKKKLENKVSQAPIAASTKKSDASKGVEIKGEGDPDKLAKLKAGALGAGTTPQQTPDVSLDSISNPAPAPAPEKNEGLFLAGIPELLPVSFTGSINYGYDSSQVNEFDFAARSLKMHAAGNFREMFGFFGTYVAYSEQPPVGNYNTSANASNNKTDINEFLLSWRHMFNTPINMRIGRMQPKLGLWKTNNKISVTNNYLPYSYTVGKESVFKVEQPQDAIELNSIIANRFYVAGGVVNRKGQNTKEGYGHVSFKFGGTDFLANEPEIDLSKDESVLDFLTLTLGSYGYYGKNGTANSNDPKNSYYRIGADAELQYKIFRLRMLGNYGYDDNVIPSTITTKTNVTSKAGTIEAEFTLLLNLITAGRFEYLQQEGNSSTNFTNNYVRRYVGTLGYAPLENLKFALEYKYEILPVSINRIGTLGATLSF